MKLCTDCKHLRGMRCMAPQNLKISLYDGEAEPRNTYGRYAAVHRGAKGWVYIRVNNYCGEVGRWWEQKEAEKCTG